MSNEALLVSKNFNKVSPTVCWPNTSSLSLMILKSDVFSSCQSFGHRVELDFFVDLVRVWLESAVFFLLHQSKSEALSVDGFAKHSQAQSFTAFGELQTSQVVSFEPVLVHSKVVVLLLKVCDISGEVVGNWLPMNGVLVDSAHCSEFSILWLKEENTLMNDEPDASDDAGKGLLVSWYKKHRTNLLSSFSCELSGVDSLWCVVNIESSDSLEVEITSE